MSAAVNLAHKLSLQIVDEPLEVQLLAAWILVESLEVEKKRADRGLTAPSAPSIPPAAAELGEPIDADWTDDAEGVGASTPASSPATTPPAPVALPGSQRLAQIVELVRGAGGEAQVSWLAERTGLSTWTVNQYVRSTDGQKLLERTAKGMVGLKKGGVADAD